MAVRMRTGALDVTGADRWYVTDGANSVGPVRLDLLARGVEAGRVPLDSFVRHEAWKVWRPLTDFTDYIDEPLASAPLPQFALPGDESEPRSRSSAPPKQASLIEFASSEGVPSRSSDEGMMETPEPSIIDVSQAAESWSESENEPETEAESEAEAPLEIVPVESPTDVTRDLLGADRARFAELFASPETATDDIPLGSEGWGAARPADSSDALPDDDLAGASDLSDALLLLLGGIVKRTRADGALLFRMDDDGAKVVCAHGPEMLSALGHRVDIRDPAVLAAITGNIVVTEPRPGPVGQAMVSRLERLGVTPVSALLLPIRIRGRLLGFLELGKSALASTQGFTPREVVKAEDLVSALARHIADRGFSI